MAGSAISISSLPIADILNLMVTRDFTPKELLLFLTKSFLFLLFARECLLLL